MRTLYDMAVWASLAGLLAIAFGLFVMWCWRFASRQLSRGGLAVFLIAIGIATVEAQKNGTNSPLDGVSAPLMGAAPATGAAGAPGGEGAETNLCFSGIARTEGGVSLELAWSEDARLSDHIDIFGNWSLTNRQWVLVDSFYLRWPVPYLTVEIDWPEVFTNAVSSGVFSTNATLSAGFFAAEWELDSDGDWLWDGEERLVYHTDPFSSDSDGDGLLDGDEVFDYGTDPANPDTDGDGFCDGWDAAYYDALDPDEPSEPDADDDGDGLSNRLEYELGSAPDSSNSDGDSLPDSWEAAHGLDPASAVGQDGDAGDPDFDGYQNIEEYWYGTDPRDPDSDGDGKPDGLDELPRQTESGSFTGPSEWWIRKTYPDVCNEILRVGYSVWVDSRVGRNQQNGYCKFVASFPEAPATPVLLNVGSCRMMVDEAGDYPFLLEKGLEYTFGTCPFVSNVVYTAVDDIAPRLTSWSGPDEQEGVWTVDSRGMWLVLPHQFSMGLFHWMPSFCGTPDRQHVDSLDGCTFTASFSDCGPSVSASYLWSCSDDNVVFEHPRARTTRVSFATMPAWRQARLLAQATIGTNVLESALNFSYGENQTQHATLELSVPKVIAVGETVRCTVTVRTADDEGGCIYLRKLTSIGVDAWSDAELTQPLGDVSEFEVGSESEMTVDFYVKATSSSTAVDAEMFASDYETSAETLSQTCRFTAIEPIVEPITTEKVDGRIVNPCCGIVGSNAWFKVGVYPESFPDASIHWRVDEGSASFLRGNTGRQVLVAPYGENPIVLSVDFGGYTDARTKFNLQPTQLYEVPVFACEIVSEEENATMVEVASMNSLLKETNVIYEQVGLHFYLSGCITSITNDVWNKNGLIDKNIGQQIRDSQHDTGGVEVYFIKGSRHRDEHLGSCNEGGCVVRKQTHFTVLAHELGHACGLTDVYVMREKKGRYFTGSDYEILERKMPMDWGSYDFMTTQEDLVKKILMYGVAIEENIDIPCGSVFGLDKRGIRGVMNVGRRGMILYPPYSN